MNTRHEAETALRTSLPSAVISSSAPHSSRQSCATRAFSMRCTTACNRKAHVSEKIVPCASALASIAQLVRHCADIELEHVPTAARLV